MPTRRDADGRWHVEVCVHRRRLHRRLPPGASASDARRVEAELTRALSSQPKARAVAIPGDPLLTELLGHYTERHAQTLRSPDTARHHAYRIGQWVVGKRASQARQVAAQIVRDMTGVYATATINRSLGTLKRALRLAHDVGLTHTDYSADIRRLPERNARDVYLTLDQVAHLANHASEQTRAAIWLAMLTGCRRGEILALRPEDIGADALLIRAGGTKTLRTRTVPIIPALRPWLTYIPLQINAEGLKSGFRRAREAAGMPHVHYHDLRHSCATVLLSLGTPLDVVRDILGHTTIKTTERYAHALVHRQREALGKLGDAAAIYTGDLHRAAAG